MGQSYVKLGNKKKCSVATSKALYCVPVCMDVIIFIPLNIRMVTAFINLLYTNQKGIRSKVHSFYMSLKYMLQCSLFQ